MKRLPKSLSVQVLKEAWKNSRDSKSGSTPGAPGVDRMRAPVFASELTAQILQLRDAIRSGTFRFSRLRMAPVPKPSGGHRIIAIPTVRDRLLQRALLAELEADPKFQSSSAIAYGFTKGRTLADAQLVALGLRKKFPWVLQADIVKFFDQIPRAQMQRLIRRKVRRKVIADLLCKGVECELEDVGGKGAEIVRDSGIARGVGLRQGMPVSPMLSNLLLKAFDEALSEHGLIAIRYADDVAIFGKSRHELLDALKFVNEALSKLQLRIPDLEENRKTKISGPSDPVEFLGVEIRRHGDSYELSAPAKKLVKIEAQMAEMATISECVKNRRNLGQVARSLDSFIVGHGASMAVLDDAPEFIRRLEAAKQRQLNVLLTELLGEKTVKSLDGNQRAILGLERFQD